MLFHLATLLFCLLEPMTSFASLSEVSSLFSSLKTDLEAQNYESALGKAKYYRLKLLPKDAQYFNYKILLAEAYVLGKFCYQDEVDQLVTLINFYNEKYQLGLKDLKMMAKDLKLLGLGAMAETSKKADFFEKKASWPIGENSIKLLNRFEDLKVYLRPKC